MENILIIEDEEAIRNSLSDFLISEGYNCSVAGDGMEGLKAARDFIPDLILCDIKMPLLSGHEVLQEIRNDPKLSTIPFILITAVLRDNVDLRYGMSLGADDYIIKPFKPDDLLSSIKARLHKYEAVKNKFDSLRKNIAVALPHELQTPLVSIVGYSEILMDRMSQMDDKEGIEFANLIHEAGLRLNRLIQKFIIYTKLELRSKDPKRATTKITSPPVITEALIKEMVKNVAERFKRISDLTLDVSPTSARIIIDDLNVILEELFENAFKFSPLDSKVIFKLYSENGNCIINITDFGRGFTDDQISNLGEFHQFDRDKYEQQGLGLGLSIIQKIISFYDGKILIESKKDKQTTIKIILPSG